LANEPAICAAVLQGMHSLVSVCVCEWEREGGGVSDEFGSSYVM
jgi:hypothetical protein